MIDTPGLKLALPLEVMRTTGDAHLDSESSFTPSGEYVAALYESYASEHEWNDGVTALTRPPGTPVTTWFAGDAHDYTMAEYGQSLESLGRYCATAERVAEDLWTRDVESAMGF